MPMFKPMTIPAAAPRHSTYSPRRNKDLVDDLVVNGATEATARQLVDSLRNLVHGDVPLPAPRFANAPPNEAEVEAALSLIKSWIARRR